MEKVRFINYHTFSNEQPKRTGALSAINKVNYVIEVLTKLYDEVEIISPSWIIGDSRGYTSAKRVSISPNVNIIYTPSWGGDGKLQRLIKYALSRLWLIYYLLCNIHRNETVFVYHQPTLMMPIKIIRLIKRFKLAIEDEEIYKNVGEVINVKKRDKELAYLRNADAYIFPTILLNEKVNKNNKPFVISHGTYSVEKCIAKPFNDGKIHCVYAGTFNQIKGGVYSAIQAGKYLNNNYHLHIIGFGSEKETKKVISDIKECNELTNCIITYDGMLSGEEYIKFLQRCHIGLSTQNSDAIYNETSFPSKILSYMANGLRVVSVKLKVLEKSSINEYLYYCENNDFKSIANAIYNVNIHDDYDSRKLIYDLNYEFINNMNSMIQNIKH